MSAVIPKLARHHRMWNVVNLFCRQAIITTLPLLALAFLTNGHAIADEVTRVFLFAGQSNMVGSDATAERIDDYPDFKGAREPQSNVLYSYILGNGDEASKGWVPRKPLRSFGPEVTFARRIRQHARFPIAIIKSAVGGTTVAFDWNPEAPDKGQKLYPRTLNRTITAALRGSFNGAKHSRPRVSAILGSRRQRSTAASRTDCRLGSSWVLVACWPTDGNVHAAR